jgi:transcriptional regulator with GAF, ATPase, and Fis domain
MAFQSAVPPAVVSSMDQFMLPSAGIDLEGLEIDLVRQALEAAGNNQTEAARLLGLTRGKFRILLKRIKESA